MDAWQELATEALEQLNKGLAELSEADYGKLMTGELRVSVSFVRPPARKATRRQAEAPVADDTFGDVQARLAAAGSREEGQRIVEEAFARKERLFAFARYLDLPVQRTDTVTRMRGKGGDAHGGTAPQRPGGAGRRRRDRLRGRGLLKVEDLHRRKP